MVVHFPYMSVDTAYLPKKLKLVREIKDWRMCLKEADDKERIRIFHEHILTGRPLGEKKFIDKLEQKFGRILRKIKPGPKKR